MNVLYRVQSTREPRAWWARVPEEKLTIPENGFGRIYRIDRNKNLRLLDCIGDPVPWQGEPLWFYYKAGTFSTDAEMFKLIEPEVP